MRYEFVNELEVESASADDVWAIYSSLILAKLYVEQVPSVESKVVLEGDGGVGTVFHVHFHSGFGLPRTYKEKVVTNDNYKRLKEVLQMEGGHMDMGFTFYMKSFQIIEKTCNSCIIRTITKYEIKDEYANNVWTSTMLASFDSLVTLARVVSAYVLKHKN